MSKNAYFLDFAIVLCENFNFCEYLLSDAFCFVFQILHKSMHCVILLKTHFEQKKIEPYYVSLGTFSLTKISITLRNLKIGKSAVFTLIFDLNPSIR